MPRSRSSSSKPTLIAISATVSRALGDLVVQSISNSKGVWYRVKMSHSEKLKSAIKNYIAANNKVHHTRFQAHFPKPFVLQLSEGEERPRASRGSAERAGGDPAR